MTVAAAETTSLIAFTLPGTPYSVQMARFYVRAALSYHDLGDYAEDAQAVTSELVANAVEHSGAQAISLELTSLHSAGAIVIVVSDACPKPPVMRDPADEAEHGRGLRIVDALSARWGWRPQDHGKVIYAILTRKETATDDPGTVRPAHAGGLHAPAVP